jgi:hypothetical protein
VAAKLALNVLIVVAKVLEIVRYAESLEELGKSKDVNEGRYGQAGPQVAMSELIEYYIEEGVGERAPMLFERHLCYQHW